MGVFTDFMDRYWRAFLILAVLLFVVCFALYYEAFSIMGGLL